MILYFRNGMFLKLLLILVFLNFCAIVSGQRLENQSAGIIAGTVVDEQKSLAVSGAVITLSSLQDSIPVLKVISDKNGEYYFDKLAYGNYSVLISMTGYTPIIIDSINLRKERNDFNLGESKLIRSVVQMPIVMVYSEKPLYENKDGKIIFNASESALSNSSSTSDLLKQTPLVNIDPDGKLLLRGKEVKVLIDDKPVDMDSRQLQDLLESMPGSMIEKIEVLTTPPPQYANERGGVLNIVTKKGKIGMTGRLNVNYVTRGEYGSNASVSYRKKRFAVNASLGYSQNKYNTYTVTHRQNIYADSTNFFNTNSANRIDNKRPHGRIAIDFDINKKSTINFSLLYNRNLNENNALSEFANVSSKAILYRFSNRQIVSNSERNNPSGNLAYTVKGKNPKELFRLNAGFNSASNDNDRDFYQAYFDPSDFHIVGDSLQQQSGFNENRSYNLRLNYDKPIHKKYSLNIGSGYQRSVSKNQLSTSFLDRSTNVFLENPAYSNDFKFFQTVVTFRSALRYDIGTDAYVQAGLQEEFTITDFDLQLNNNNYKNDYHSHLPFFTIMKKWVSGYNITGSYKRTVQRPGANQLNPSIDYGDPYNLRFGNPFLKPYYAENFDLIVAYWKKAYNLNISVGYNSLSDIYSSVRLLQPDSKTIVTWQNISGRKEYETHIWGGVTINKKIKLNSSANYIYNKYSETDKAIRKFRDGGTLSTSLTGNYQHSQLLNFTTNITYNSFATPQGSSRNNLSMNIGGQKKFFDKNLTISVNVIDPFGQQQNEVILYGNNYILESINKTNTRNFKIAAAYSFRKKVKKKLKVNQLKSNYSVFAVD